MSVRKYYGETGKVGRSAGARWVNFNKIQHKIACNVKQIIVVERPKVTSRSLRSFRNKLSGVYQKSQNVSEQNCNASWSKVLFQLIPSSSSMLLYVHRSYGPLGMGSPGHPPQLSHSSWVLTESKILCSIYSTVVPLNQVRLVAMDLHISQSNLTKQQDANRIGLGCAAVVGGLGHHVCKVDSFAEHVASLKHIHQSRLFNLLPNTLPLWNTS